MMTPKSSNPFNNKTVYLIVLLLLIVLILLTIAQIQENTTRDKSEDSFKNTNVPEIEWALYKAKFEKTYNQSEDLRRMMIYYATKRNILKHNERFKKGEESYSMQINQFSDMTDEEFAEQMSIPVDDYEHNETETEDFDEVELNNTESLHYFPSHVDWREKGAVTRIKDQGKCKSCWAFSATGALEAQRFIRSKNNTSITLQPLSEQNLIDCAKLSKTKGCKGGWPDMAFEYIRRNKGIDSEKSYQYEGRLSKCRYNAQNSIASVKWYQRLPKSEFALKKAVAYKGPVSVVVDSRHMKDYHEGIFYNKFCRNTLQYLDHAVLVIGYGYENSKPYWLIKNSWGTLWGQQGYMKLARRRGNHCGIVTRASIPYV